MTVAGLVVTLIAVGTLAFGAVYPWAYVPLFAAAALIGAVGLGRHGARPEVRPLAIALLVVWVAVAVQLMPMPRRSPRHTQPSGRQDSERLQLDVRRWRPDRLAAVVG